MKSGANPQRKRWDWKQQSNRGVRKISEAGKQMVKCTISWVRRAEKVTSSLSQDYPEAGEFFRCFQRQWSIWQVGCKILREAGRFSDSSAPYLAFSLLLWTSCHPLWLALCPPPSFSSLASTCFSTYDLQPAVESTSEKQKQTHKGPDMKYFCFALLAIQPLFRWFMPYYSHDSRLRVLARTKDVNAL